MKPQGFDTVSAPPRHRARYRARYRVWGRAGGVAVALVVAGLGLTALGLGAGGPGGAGGEGSARLVPGRSLTVATVEGALPLSGTLPDGRLGGFHVAVARAVCARLEVKCRFALTAPANLVDALRSGAVDLVAADMVMSPGETAGVALAPPHGRRASVVLARGALARAVADTGALDARAPAETCLTILSGRVLAAVAGSDQAAALRALAPADVTVVLAERQAEVLRALSEGEADAALLPLSVALAFLLRDEGAGFALLGLPVLVERAGGPVSLAMAGGDESLARAVGRAVTELRREGHLMAMARETLPLPEAVVPLGVIGPGRTVWP